jgi:uncharacterized protein YdaU (DUF1376 family)
MFLLCNAWLEDPQGTLPDDDEELAALARVSMEEWKAIKPVLMSAFQRDEATGRLFNSRQMEEVVKQANRKQNGSKGGSKAQANRVATLEVANANGIASGSVPLPEHPANADEAAVYCANSGVPPDFAKLVFSKWQERHGRDGAGVDVGFLDHVVGRWTREGQSWRDGSHNGKLNGKASSTHPVTKLKAIDEVIQTHPANPESLRYKCPSADQKAELKRLRADRAALNSQIARA